MAVLSLSAEELLGWKGVMLHLAPLPCAGQVVKRKEGGERANAGEGEHVGGDEREC